MIEYYVITSNKYVHLMKDYSCFFNKNWDNNILVNILGYKSPESNLPNNFKFQSLGNQDDFGKYWTNALIPYFKNIDSEYVCILIDDLFFINHVEIEKINDIFNELKIENKTVDKILLGSIPENMLINSVPFTNSTLLISNDVDYRTTLKPSIWKTEYFKKMLKPNFTIWDFEVKNFYESKTDGSVIISHKNVNLITEFNVYDKGNFNYKNYNKIEYLLDNDEKEKLKKYEDTSNWNR